MRGCKIKYKKHKVIILLYPNLKISEYKLIVKNRIVIFADNQYSIHEVLKSLA